MKLNTAHLMKLIEQEMDVMAAKAKTATAAKNLDLTNKIVDKMQHFKDDPWKLNHYNDRLQGAKTTEEKEQLLRDVLEED